MSWTPRRFQIATTASVAAGWAARWAVYAAVVPAPPGDAVLFAVLPAVLWASAARIAVHRRWSRPGASLSARDPPGRLLAVAVAALPTRSAGRSPSRWRRCRPARPAARRRGGGAADPLGRSLAVAVAALPTRPAGRSPSRWRRCRRDWGRAMLAELAGVRGRRSRAGSP
ncbi:hypothetical protein [Phytohabitans suffuscus]|uniref:hypothetical protein n=1 Tax=Phytohabitans suffuscus TaxID=624315 RepID=UPI0015668D2E|nr:hypothetical protein [Phytohabitans suffuscus]